MSSLPCERQKSQVLERGFLQNWDFYGVNSGLLSLLFLCDIGMRVPGCRIPLLSDKRGAAAACGDDLHLFPARTRTKSILDAFCFRDTTY
jgi:hypothetical protein